MNNVVLMGRLTADPEVRYANTNDGTMAIARYTLAVDRIGEGADFIRCTAFRKNGEFAEKYLNKGMKIAVIGHIQTGSYDDKDGKRVYTTDVIVDRHEFCESKSQSSQQSRDSDGFVQIDDTLDELPFA